ncbi:DUF2267 domain-containing protein [Streptomyces sp. J2-1]|uniref:DUF2267 domain-containing protein n=1 Tax=Streptomyces corallincola TaxID=2851888 RepID=UPI001C38F1DC|nr:DUF2267 domain-containing protein [Streptomyces corallincola]MBV2354425.1 DUF2267 domain-containing protein [Streptomyces corallincola]
MTVTTPHPRLAAPALGWPELTEAVREAGRYETAPEAEQITRTVLSALGTQVTGEERVSLAQSLPHEAALLIAAEIPSTTPLTAREFVESVAARLPDTTPATARWHTTSVLTTLSTHLPTPLTAALLTQLPSGYAFLFGRAELAAPA